MSKTKVCINIDFDAVTLWLHGFGSWDMPSRISRGLFGADVGVPRLLDLLEEHDTPATWFIPGHSIETFPQKAARIADRGYEIQVHGWKHKPATDYDSKEAEKADIARAVDTVYDLTGEKPTGFRSPTANFSANTLDILQELDFEFDSTLQGHDFRAYHLRQGARMPVDEPYERGEKTGLVEIPFRWELVDVVPFTFIWSDPYRVGYADEEVFFRRWYEMFDWMHENVDGGFFMPIVHPQVIGSLPRLTYFEEFLEYVNGQPDVEFVDMQEIADEATI